MFKISLVCSLECEMQGGLSMQRALSKLHCIAMHQMVQLNLRETWVVPSSISTVVQYVSVSQSYGRFSRSGEMQ